MALRQPSTISRERSRLIRLTKDVAIDYLSAVRPRVFESFEIIPSMRDLGRPAKDFQPVWR
jgi:hypothetical protein